MYPLRPTAVYVLEGVLADRLATQRLNRMLDALGIPLGSATIVTQATIPEVAADSGAELAIFGEMLDYTIRYCVEIDLAGIELGHCSSEQPGMEGMAQFLRERLSAEIPVECLNSGRPWTYLSAEG